MLANAGTPLSLYAASISHLSAEAFMVWSSGRHLLSATQYFDAQSWICEGASSTSTD
jgi:hypothetical protein